MLRVLLNSPQDNINKDFRFIQALAKKNFKFLLYDKDVSFIFYFLLMLLLAKQGSIYKEDGGK